MWDHWLFQALYIIQLEGGTLIKTVLFIILQHLDYSKMINFKLCELHLNKKFLSPSSYFSQSIISKVSCLKWYGHPKNLQCNGGDRQQPHGRERIGITESCEEEKNMRTIHRQKLGWN